MKNNRKLKDRKEWSINGKKGKWEKKEEDKRIFEFGFERRKNNNKEIKKINIIKKENKTDERKKQVSWRN